MIDVSTADGIRTLRLSHGKASAFDLELCQALERAILEIDEDQGVDAVIVTGTGSIFSAGVDLFRVVDGGAEYVREFLPSLTRSIFNLFASTKPLVAAVNGHAIAGGCLLAAAADVRLMAEGNGRIGVPELLVGVAFPPSLLEMLRFAIPQRHLAHLVLGGVTITATEAAAAGVIDELVPADTLQDCAREAATKLMALPKAAFRLTKRQLRDAAIRHARRYESEFGADVLQQWCDPSTIEHIRAYLAKTVKK